MQGGELPQVHGIHTRPMLGINQSKTWSTILFNNNYIYYYYFCIYFSFFFVNHFALQSIAPIVFYYMNLIAMHTVYSLIFVTDICEHLELQLSEMCRNNKKTMYFK